MKTKQLFIYFSNDLGVVDGLKSCKNIYYLCFCMFSDGHDIALGDNGHLQLMTIDTFDFMKTNLPK